jgi:hypothetical protein
VDEAQIKVEAPSALLGFFLALRLQRQEAHVVETEDGRWTVEVPAGASQEWVLACVQRWLDDEALEEVVVHVDGASHKVRASRGV